MKYYIVLTKSIDQFIQESLSKEEEVPKIDLVLLAQSLNATFIRSKSPQVTFVDKICALLSSTPENWAFARQISSQLEPEDVVFCPGEEIGIPLASIYRSQKKRPQIIVWFHRITGLKSRVVLRLMNISNMVNIAVANTNPNRKFLQNYLKFTEEQTIFWRHSIDCNYFKSDGFKSSKKRPSIVSFGLEQRDYRLLAAATEELNADVKVAGFSQFQTRIAKSFPEAMPENMTNKKYPRSELIQLYHDADLVVIPLIESKAAAGLTVLLEAMSCRKAIICVRTQGLAEYLTNEEAVLTIKPGDVSSLKKAIVHLLNNPEEAKARGDRAYELVLKNHDVVRQVEVLTACIQK